MKRIKLVMTITDSRLRWLHFPPWGAVLLKLMEPIAALLKRFTALRALPLSKLARAYLGKRLRDLLEQTRAISHNANGHAVADDLPIIELYDAAVLMFGGMDVGLGKTDVECRRRFVETQRGRVGAQTLANIVRNPACEPCSLPYDEGAQLTDERPEERWAVAIEVHGKTRKRHPHHVPESAIACQVPADHSLARSGSQRCARHWEWYESVDGRCPKRRAEQRCRALGAVTRPMHRRPPCIRLLGSPTSTSDPVPCAGSVRTCRRTLPDRGRVRRHERGLAYGQPQQTPHRDDCFHVAVLAHAAMNTVRLEEIRDSACTSNQKQLRQFLWGMRKSPALSRGFGHASMGSSAGPHAA